MLRLEEPEHPANPQDLQKPLHHVDQVVELARDVWNMAKDLQLRTPLVQ